MATALLWYLALGLAGCVLFGSLMVWAENHHHERTRWVCNYLTVLCLPALFAAGLINIAGSIGHH